MFCTIWSRSVSHTSTGSGLRGARNQYLNQAALLGDIESNLMQENVELRP